MANVVDAACAAAVEEARAAAIRRSGVFEVGEHVEVFAEDVRVATHLFECQHPGYPGWHWSVTVTRASRAKAVTIDEVCLVPGEDSLLAPEWVPWADRVAAEDVVPGMLLPTPDNDPRLEPGFVGDEAERDRDPASWSVLRSVVAELGLGRQRVLSQQGRDEAAARWLESTGGPDNAMAKQAPGPCEECGYFVRLRGSLGQVFGVCTNEFSPSDAQVVAVNHGCGAHSDVTEPTRKPDRREPVWDTVSLDTSLFD